MVGQGEFPVQLRERHATVSGSRNTRKHLILQHKSANGGSDLCVFPPAAAGMGGITVAHADEHIQAVEEIGLLPDILKTDKGHVKRRTAERLNHAGVAVVFLLVQGMVCLLYTSPSPRDRG